LLEPFLYAYVLLCFKFLAKLFLPLLLKKVVQKLEKILNSSSAMLKIILGKDIHQGRSNFNTAKSKNPRETKKVGEYVDYEEID
jgi:methyltransferase-like protein